MAVSDEILDIVDENDVVIGTALRKDIHGKGLLHREVGVMFVMPTGELIFQRRSKTKATNPGRLAFTAAGHVISGDTYEQAALKETEEETGLKLMLSDLVPLDKTTFDSKLNKGFSQCYAYIFTGKLEDLHPEEGEVDEFIAVPGYDVLNPPDSLKEDMASGLLDPAIFTPMYRNILALVETDDKRNA